MAVAYSLSDIRDALADTLRDQIDLRVYPRVEDNMAGPCLVVVPAFRSTVSFTESMGKGTDGVEFHVYVLVPRTHMAAAQDILDAVIDGGGDMSVRRAIFANRRLGLGDDAAVDAYAAGVEDYGSQYAIAGFEHIGARILVGVLMSPRTT